MNDRREPNAEQGLAPIEDECARVLILGSMPSVTSLRDQAYYAHPQNAFWPIMRTYFCFSETTSYAASCQMLRRAGVAVWDVIASCVRPGSLDAAIRKESVRANDLAAFMQTHPLVSAVFFNGAMAEQTCKRHNPQLFQRDDLRCIKLPSTSPAHASLSREQKLQKWSEQLDLVFDNL